MWRWNCVGASPLRPLFHTQLSWCLRCASALSLEQLLQFSTEWKPVDGLSGGHCSGQLWGFFASVLPLFWVDIKLFSQISINNRKYKFYKYADFGGPGVFVTATACLFKLLENNYLFFFFPLSAGYYQSTCSLPICS